MAILGNNHFGTTSRTGCAGRNYASKFVLASPSVVSELHGWFGLGGAGQRVQITLYADTGSGAPGALLAYTAPLATTGGDLELSQSGFSVSLAPGTYWLGWCGENVGTAAAYYDDDTVTRHAAQSSGATFNPPQNPYPSPPPNGFGVRIYSMWAVVSPVQPRPTRIQSSQGWVDIGNASAFVSGSGAPLATVGATGAIYLDVATGSLYGPKAGGAWPGMPITTPSLAAEPLTLLATWQGYVPSAPGVGAVWRAPFPEGVSTTFNLTRAYARVEIPGAAGLDIVVQKSPAGAFVAAPVTTLTVAAGTNEVEDTTSLGTVVSGELLRISFPGPITGFPALTPFTVELEGEEV